MNEIFSKSMIKPSKKQVTEYLISNIENIMLNGVQLILNQVFKLNGFDLIEDGIFRQLVISLLSQPMSKAATVEYLKSPVFCTFSGHPCKLL